MASLQNFNLHRGKTLLLRRPFCELSLDVDFEDYELSRFLSLFLPRIYSHFASEQVVSNLKGRDQGQAAASENESSSAERDELLFLQGRIGDREKKFSFRIDTPFESFPKYSEIAHRLNFQQKPLFPHSIHWEHYGMLAPLKPESFRFGLQEFRARVVAPLFGLTPSMSDELLIDANSKKLFLRSSASRLREEKQIPMRKSGMLALALEALGEMCSEDLSTRFT